MLVANDCLRIVLGTCIVLVSASTEDLPLNQGSWRIGKPGVGPRFLSAAWRAESAAAVKRTMEQGQGHSHMLTDIYQFGVYTGGSLREIRRQWMQRGLGVRAVWGLDSFEGLAPVSDVFDHKTWTPGAFSAAGAFGTSVFSEICSKILAHIVADGDHLSADPRSDAFAKKVQFVRGFYNESLTPSLAAARGMAPAIYVDIDVDQYVPAKQVLSWLFREHLAVAGTFIGYDDFGSTRLWTAGESRAHEEIAAEYKVEFEHVFSPCNASSKHAYTSAPTQKRHNCSSIPGSRCRKLTFPALFRVVSVGRKQSLC